MQILACIYLISSSFFLQYWVSYLNHSYLQSKAATGWINLILTFMSKLPKPTLWKLWNPAEAREHSPGTSATGNGHSKKHTSVHLVAFDLYYLDQRSNDYICLKDHNEGQRCKKGQFNPIQDCIWARHTQNRGSKTLQTQKVRTRVFPSPVSDYSVRSRGGTYF